MMSLKEFISLFVMLVVLDIVWQLWQRRSWKWKISAVFIHPEKDEQWWSETRTYRGKEQYRSFTRIQGFTFRDSQIEAFKKMLGWVQSFSLT